MILDRSQKLPELSEPPFQKTYFDVPTLEIAAGGLAGFTQLPWPSPHGSSVFTSEGKVVSRWSINNSKRGRVQFLHEVIHIEVGRLNHRKGHLAVLLRVYFGPSSHRRYTQVGGREANFPFPMARQRTATLGPC